VTRAQEILALVEAIGDPKPFKKPANPFKHQYSHQPGQKIPTHMKMRQMKQKQVASRSSASYSKPWKGHSDMPRDKALSPLSSKMNNTPIHKIG
jgi:hypothetical protein